MADVDDDAASAGLPARPPRTILHVMDPATPSEFRGWHPPAAPRGDPPGVVTPSPVVVDPAVPAVAPPSYRDALSSAVGPVPPRSREETVVLPPPVSLDDAWLTAPARHTSPRSSVPASRAPSVSQGGNRYAELDDNTTEPPEMEEEPNEPEPDDDGTDIGTTQRTKSTDVFATAMGMNSPGWHKLKGTYGYDTTDGLVRALRDHDGFAVTKDALNVDGTPLTTDETAVLTMVQGQIGEMDKAGEDPFDMLRDLDHDQWKMWKTYTTPVYSAKAAPPPVGIPAKRTLSVPDDTPSRHYGDIGLDEPTSNKPAGATTWSRIHRRDTNRTDDNPREESDQSRWRRHHSTQRMRHHTNSPPRGRYGEHRSTTSARTPETWSDRGPPHSHDTAKVPNTGRGTTYGHGWNTSELGSYRYTTTPDMGNHGYTSGTGRNREPPPTVDGDGNPIMAKRTTLIQRKVQADKITRFDGQPEHFERFKYQFQIQLGFRQISYLVETRLVRTWVNTPDKTSPDIAAILPPHLRYYDQVHQDNEILFNLIGLAIGNSSVRHFVNAVIEGGGEPDGIAMWHKLLQQFWNEDGAHLRKIELLQILGTPLEKGETMEVFLNRMDRAYGQVCNLCHIPATLLSRLDDEFKLWLLAQIRDPTYVETKERLRDDIQRLRLPDLMHRLRSTARNRRAEAITLARRRAHLALPYPVKGGDTTVSANIVRRIAPDKWKGLDADIQRVISELRQENAIVVKQSSILVTLMTTKKIPIPLEYTELQERLNRMNRQDEQKSEQGHTGTTTALVPKQYSKRANIAYQEPPNHNMDMEMFSSTYSDNGVQDIYSDSEAEEEPRNVQANLSAREVTILLAGSSEENHHTMTVIDGGADTCVLGVGWRPISMTVRKAHVTGFDNRCKTANALPIGSAVTMVDTEDGPVMLLVHEAVINEGGISLLSSFQIRDYGLVVDDTGKMHGGEPRLQIDDDRYIQLDTKRGLTVCHTRLPDDTELQKHTPYTITGDDVWDPRKYDNDTDQKQAYIHSMTVGENDRVVHPEDDVLTVLHVTSEKPQDQPKNPGRSKQASYSFTRLDKDDIQALVPKFIYRPKEIIEQTLRNTTALAKGEMRAPLRRHLRSRFPQLNVRRINETVASDTLFGTEQALGGYTCAQLFVGVQSKRVDVYAMRSEADGTTALQDYIRMVGAPKTLRTDNSKMQLGQAWQRILRRMLIKGETTEPHHPWQNYAERVIGTLKRQVNTLLDRTGAPDRLWMLALEHVAYVWNHTSQESDNGATPIQMHSGDTPDISALLMFEFFEPVFYYDPTHPFPESKESIGRFVGVAEHVGDALCYKILVEKSQTVLHRSVVRPAEDQSRNNKRVFNQAVRRTGVRFQPQRSASPALPFGIR